MAISAAGVGSNIDVNGIVSQLVALERRPLDLLKSKKNIFNAELSAYGKLKSDLASLQTAIGKLKNTDSFKVFSATSADTSVFTATAGSGALAGSHSVTVSQLAKAQKLVSSPQNDTNTFQYGTGTLTISNGTDSFDVTIDSDSNTLEGVANAVNSASGNFGVSATILNDGTGYRLVFSPDETGASNAVTIAVNQTSGNLSQLSYTSGAYNLTQTQPAQNAILTVDGLVDINSASNTVSDVIQGVTLSLKTEGSTTVQVGVDSDKLTSTANEFISAYNQLARDINDLHKKGGTLEGHNTVLTLQAQITAVFNTSINISGNDYSAISQVGISIQKDGTLSLDSSKFKAALDGNVNDLNALFTDSNQGFAQRLYAQLGNLLQTDGVLDAKTSGINRSISDIDNRSDQLQVRLDAIQTRLLNQFAALDSLVGSLKQTSNALLAQLGR